MDRSLRYLFATISIGIVVFILAVFLNRTEFLWTRATLLVLIVFPLVYLTASIFVVFHGRTARLNLLIVSVSSVVTLYIANLMLMIAGPFITLPAEFDRRSKLQVVMELRQEGIKAVPSIHPKDFIFNLLDDGSKKIMPLSGIRNATTVFCNEIGRYYIYVSDEHGFTNPIGIHSSDALDVALVGDSFTQGFCAPGGTSFAEKVRADYPSTINLGNNGNGPLVELATLREFLIPLRPKQVFWFFFEGNDPEDLSNELQNPVLLEYLKDPSYSQNLRENVEGNDALKREFLGTRINQELEQQSFWGRVKEIPEKIRLWLGLWHFRALLGVNDVRRDWKLHRWNKASSSEEVASALRAILGEARGLVEGWGGRFTLVYLPSYRTYGYGITHPWRERVLEIGNDLELEILDLLPVFAQHSDPVALYAFRKEGHYTELGNQVVADVIIKSIRDNHEKVVLQTARQSRPFSFKPGL